MTTKNAFIPSPPQIYIPRASTKAFVQSIFVAGDQTYNTLDLSIRNSKTTLSFAKKLRSL